MEPDVDGGAFHVESFCDLFDAYGLGLCHADTVKKVLTVRKGCVDNHYMTTTNETNNNFHYVAAVGASRWYGFTTREEAEAWVETNAYGREATIAPICLVDGAVVAP